MLDYSLHVCVKCGVKEVSFLCLFNFFYLVVTFECCKAECQR